MHLIRNLTIFLAVVLAHSAFADDTTDAEYGNENANYDDQGVYRDGGQGAEAAIPWMATDPNTDDAQILEDQSNPWPTVDYGEPIGE